MIASKSIFCSLKLNSWMQSARPFFTSFFGGTIEMISQIRKIYLECFAPNFWPSIVCKSSMMCIVSFGYQGLKNLGGNWCIPIMYLVIWHSYTSGKLNIPYTNVSATLIHIQLTFSYVILSFLIIMKYTFDLWS